MCHKDIKLDIGAGRIRHTGYIAIDCVQIIDNNGDKCIDIVRDIEKHGLPFCDNSVDEVRAESFLEHIDDLIFVMNECWRVLKPNGIMWGTVPRASTDGSFRDPTHKRFFTKSTFDYFCGEHKAFSNQPSHPKNANYNIKPWYKIEVKDGICFKLKPRK